MSFTLDPLAAVLVTGRARGAHWLLECYFRDGTQYFTTAGVDVLSPNGTTYLGLGQYLTIEDVQEQGKPDTGTLNIQLQILDPSLLRLLTGDQTIYRGRKCKLLTQFFDENFVPVGQPCRRWQGAMDCIKIQREKVDPSSGQTSAYIEMPLIRHGMERARTQTGIRMTDQQQRLKYPTDTFFSYMIPLINNPTPWLTIAFQKQ